MKCLTLLLSSICSLFLASCSGTGTGGMAGKPFPDARPATRIYLEGTPDWHSMDDVRAACGSKVKITGKIVDLQGAELNGSRMKHPKNPQDEGAAALKIHIPGFYLRNGQVRDIPGGIVAFAEGCRMENLLFRKIGEDAVSNQKDVSAGFQISRCRFEGTKENDKLAQINDARDAVVENSTFTGGVTAIRMQESSAKKQGGSAESIGNTFVDVRTAHNVAGRTTVYHKGNVFTRVLKEWVTGDKAVIVAK